jgi:hypothetical protein
VGSVLSEFLFKSEERSQGEVKREAKEMEMWVFVWLEKRQMQGA